jgi:hypothetical protein
MKYTDSIRTFLYFFGPASAAGVKLYQMNPLFQMPLTIGGNGIEH